jgi:hypothetical protein
VSIEEGSFEELLGAQCPKCDENNDGRSKKGKRLYSVGFLQRDVLLYNESNPVDPKIFSAFKQNLH